MKLILSLAITLCVNVFLFLGQVAINDVNPDANQFYDYDNSFLSNYDAGNYTIDEDVNSKLPGGTSSVSPTTGNVFTDAWTSLKDWFSQSTGFYYVKGFVTAVPNFLKSLHLPAELVYSLGAIWYGINLFLLVMFLRGGGGY